MKTASDIAKGLSENQRNALLFWPNGYADPNTVKSLRRRGLALGMKLTDLGEEVRSILAEGDGDADPA